MKQFFHDFQWLLLWCAIYIGLVLLYGSDSTGVYDLIFMGISFVVTVLCMVICEWVTTVIFCRRIRRRKW